MLILMTSLGVLYWSCYQLKLPGRLIESDKSRYINSVLVYIFIDIQFYNKYNENRQDRKVLSSEFGQSVPFL